MRRSFRTGRAARPRRRCRRDSAAWLAIAGLLLSTAACGRILLPSQREDVEAWLVAEERDSAMDARIVRLGKSWWTGRATTDVLVDALEGPGAAGAVNLGSRFAHSYQRIPDPAASGDLFRARFLANAVASFQSRAAFALGEIGGDRAREGLEAALRADSAGDRAVREDVRDALHRAAVRARTPGSSGAGYEYVGATLDTVDVRVRDARVRLIGAPFPDDVALASDDTLLRFLLAAPAGAYEAVLETDAPDGIRRFPVLVDRVSYAPSSPALAPELWDARRPRRRVFSLLSGTADSTSGDARSGTPTDYFRISPGEGTVAEVQVAWRGPGQLRARFLPCPVPEQSGWIQGTVLDTTSGPFAGARIRVPGSSIDVLTDQNGRFRFQAAALPPLPFQIRVQRLGSPPTTVTVDTLSGNPIMVWTGFPDPPVAVANPDVARPYQLNTIDVARSIAPKECRLLRVEKLDRDVDYLITRITVTFRTAKP